MQGIQRHKEFDTVLYRPLIQCYVDLMRTELMIAVVVALSPLLIPLQLFVASCQGCLPQNFAVCICQLLNLKDTLI